MASYLCSTKQPASTRKASTTKGFTKPIEHPTGMAGDDVPTSVPVLGCCHEEQDLMVFGELFIPCPILQNSVSINISKSAVCAAAKEECTFLRRSLSFLDLRYLLVATEAGGTHCWERGSEHPAKGRRNGPRAAAQSCTFSTTLIFC